MLKRKKTRKFRLAFVIFYIVICYLNIACKEDSNGKECNCRAYSYISIDKNGDTLFPAFQNIVQLKKDTISNITYKNGLSYAERKYPINFCNSIIKSGRLYYILGTQEVQIVDLKQPSIGDTFYVPSIGYETFEGVDGLWNVNFYRLVLDSVIDTDLGNQFDCHGDLDSYGINLTDSIEPQLKLSWQGGSAHAKGEGRLLFHPILGVTSRLFFENDSSAGRYNYKNRQYVINIDCFKKYRKHF